MMNKLIKELGGYDAAKAHYDEFSKKIAYPQLRDALLEYRRANNIFEVGDKLVLVGAGTKDVLLEVIEYKYTNDLYRVKVLSTGSSGSIHKDDIRHTTPEEIQAGRRL